MAPANSSLNIYALLEHLTIDGEEECTTPSPSSADINAVFAEDNAADYDDDNRQWYEEDEQDDDFEPMETCFDLLILEQEQAQRPLFSKDLLQEIASQVSWITLQQSRSVSERTIDHLEFTQPNGQGVTIWRAKNVANAIRVEYMTRVETSPIFQSRFGHDWKRSIPIHFLNPSLSEAQLTTPPPYYLTSFNSIPDTTHLSSTSMTWWRTRLHRTQQLWNSSTSCEKLTSAIRLGASKLTCPITKIVCFGLGALGKNAAFYSSSHQHMAAFSLANTLNTYNQAKHPEAPAVQIILSDPCYRPIDHILLQELTSSPLGFGLSSPNALLAVDANALVMTAYLPVTVPLMQILADVFAGKSKEGPGMVLCDQMRGMGVEKRWYVMTDRSSPAVAMFLLGGYLVHKEGFGGMEEEFREDAFGGEKHMYWLEDMKLWLRKE
jgi:hypothetical protein